MRESVPRWYARSVCTVHRPSVDGTTAVRVEVVMGDRDGGTRATVCTMDIAVSGTVTCTPCDDPACGKGMRRISWDGGSVVADEAVLLGPERYLRCPPEGRAPRPGACRRRG